MHWKTERFIKHWWDTYGSAKSLEEVIKIAGISSNHLKRGVRKGDEHPHKRVNWTRNTSGVIGVTKEKSRNRWRATLNVKGEQWVVICKTFEEACVERRLLERKHLEGA